MLVTAFKEAPTAERALLCEFLTSTPASHERFHSSKRAGTHFLLNPCAADGLLNVRLADTEATLHESAAQLQGKVVGVPADPTAADFEGFLKVLGKWKAQVAWVLGVVPNYKLIEELFGGSHTHFLSEL
eukprot:Blabericola_migrator_1__50@NODE_1010_length_5714_cov_79_058438_g693_i0_p5_GENE_NODE_1010_length_5714_cov_79_058438_g693_i0NODE_1010_length_5714_cov_79_058438_g693_i0_p5_ORF_typecomplete_len129_score22_29_NODE_1010_length_5714_cov_79_058438_g693_i021402526